MQIKLVSSYFDLKIFLIFDSNIFIYVKRKSNPQTLWFLFHYLIKTRCLRQITCIAYVLDLVRAGVFNMKNLQTLACSSDNFVHKQRFNR